MGQAAFVEEVLCALGSEGFCEVVGYVFLRWYVLKLDRFSMYVLLYVVVFDVIELSVFGGSRVLGDEDCGFVVYKQEGVGSVSGVWESTRRRRSQCACCVAVVAAKYSGSYVAATTDCLA